MLAYVIDADAHAALADPIKAEYKKRDSDGKYVLDVSGAVPSDKLKEFRDNNIALQKQLDAFADVDPAKYAELVAIEKELRNGKLKDGKTVKEIVEEQVAAMKAAHEKETAKLKGDLEKTTTSLSRLTITDAAITAAAALGLRASAKDDLAARVGNMFKLKDGKPVAFGPDGVEIYGAGGEPLTMQEYVTGLVEKAPHLFDASQGTGANNGGNGGGKLPPGARPAINPWAKATWNVTKQGEIWKQNQELAKKMAAEYGHKIGGA